MAACQPEANFVKELPEKFKCSICTNLLVTPVLTECCGQHFCKACLEKWLQRKPMDTCPQCRTEKFNRIVSQPIIREINELEVYCRNRDNRCGEIIAYGMLQKHVETCQYGIVECTNECGQEGLLRKDLEEHCQKKCSHRIVYCGLCYATGRFYVIVGPHTKTCPEVSVECLKCGEKIKRKDIDDHKQVCPLEMVECPFREAGCEAKLPRKIMEKHEDTSMRKHLQLTMTTTMATKRDHEKLQAEHEKLQSEHEKVQSEHEKLQSEHEKLQSEHKDLQTRFNTIVSIVSTELDSLRSRFHTRDSLLTTPEIDRIGSMLTSATTMIKPDGKRYSFRLTDTQGLLKKPEMLTVIRSHSIRLRWSSPLLCIHPSCKAYFGLGIELGFPVFILVTENQKMGDKVSVEISQVDKQPLFKVSAISKLKLSTYSHTLASGSTLHLSWSFIDDFDFTRPYEYCVSITFWS